MLKSLLIWLGLRKNPVWETMTEVRLPGYRVRVWRNSPVYAIGPEQEVIAAVNNAAYRPYLRIIEAAVAVDGVVAVEIVNTQGNGTLYDPDWR